MGRSLDERHRELVRAAAWRGASLRRGAFSVGAAALLLHLLMGWAWVWLWAGGYALAQGLERLLSDRMRQAAPADGRGWRSTVSAAQATAATAVGWIVVPLWLWGGPAGGVAALAFGMGAVLNLMVVSRGSRTAFLSGAAPHLVLLLLQPVLALHVGVSAGEFGLLLLAYAMLGGTILTAWREHETGARAQLDAHRQLEDRRAEAEAASAAKSAFVAAVSHELRTPLSGMMAAAAELQRRSADPEQAECAAIVADSARFMQVLLTDLLDLSKIEAGRMSVEQRPFDLALLAHDVGRFWSLEAAKRGVPLQLTSAFGLPHRVTGDPVRFRQILNNLLSNAFKFTGDGGVSWSIHAAPQWSGVQAVTVRVTDTGPGIPAEAQERLFAPFQQADVTIARTHGGTGLGLAISRELARVMDGDLRVESAPGQGATFILTVNLRPAEADLSRAPDQPETAAVELGTGLRVLVADDHEINRRTLAMLLEAVEADLVMARDGAEALELAEGQAFDLILMDVVMPAMGGRTAVRRLRAGSGPNRATPVIAVTGADRPTEVQACLAAGMNACVAKPLTAEGLYAAIQGCLASDEEQAEFLSA